MGLKRKYRIWFTDFWKNFDAEDNWFIKFLQSEFDVELDPHHPEFIIYSRFGNQFRKYKCKRIFYTGENIRPNFFECDYALGFDFFPDNNRYIRLPLYGIDPEREPVHLLNKRPSFESWLHENRGFCSFVVSADNCSFRKDFFLELSSRVPIASGGRLFNNMGGAVTDKFNFIRRYYLNLAFENESFPGYTTEKIFQPMFTNTIPVYWGNPLIHLDFNVNSFIQVKDVQSGKAIINFLDAAHQNLELLKPIYEQPWFVDNAMNRFVDRTLIRSFFGKIFSSEAVQPVAQNYYCLAVSKWRRVMHRVKKMS